MHWQTQGDCHSLDGVKATAIEELAVLLVERVQG
jgi:hypothetical protein